MNLYLQDLKQKRSFTISRERKNISKHLQKSIDMYGTIGQTTNMWTDIEGTDLKFINIPKQIGC